MGRLTGMSRSRQRRVPSVRPSAATAQRTSRTSAPSVWPKLTAVRPAEAASRRTSGSSALYTNTPPGFIPATISPLAAASASRLGKNSRCTLPTLVTTATSGGAAAHSAAISPLELIPISSTATSCSGRSPNSAMGMPRVLLKLPGERNTR